MMDSLYDYAYLTMWMTVASFAGTCVVLGNTKDSRRKFRMERRMSRVTVLLGVASCTLFICASYAR